MTTVSLQASRALWHRRERRAHRRWRFHRFESEELGTPRNLALRKRYWMEFLRARAARRYRDVQLARVEITSLSADGLDFLIEQEGLVLHPYDDTRGFATIGVGHVLHRGPVTEADRERYRGFERGDAERLLHGDLDRYERAVLRGARAAKVEVTQAMFDALVSLAFNIGPGDGGFADSAVVERLAAGDRDGAADAFLASGEPERRRRERARFLNSST